MSELLIIPKGYKVMVCEYPEAPETRMFVLPLIKAAIINNSANATAKILRLIFN